MLSKDMVPAFCEKLANCMEGQNLYNFMDGILGFYSQDPSAFLQRALAVESRIQLNDLEGRAKLLEGVTLYYMSESKSQTEVGWVDKAYCLNQFFMEETMEDSLDWANFCNAITYQCNVSGKCYRMANLFGHLGDMLRKDLMQRKSLLWSASAMLYQLSDQMRDNVEVLRDVLEDRGDLSIFNLWYVAEGREDMLDTESDVKAEDNIFGHYWMVPKMDDFFRGDVSIQRNYMNPMNSVKGFPTPKYAVQRYKEKRERKILDHALKILLKDLAMAWAMLKESLGDGDQTDGDAVSTSKG